MFRKTSPILPAKNILTTGLFYRDKLNFYISYTGNYLDLSREGIQIFFYEHSDIQSFLPASCFIFVNNIEDLFAGFSSMGMIGPEGMLVEKQGTIKEFCITDNNGNLLRFRESR